ncbi:GTP-binding protein [Sulfurovum lithotrophicum]|nr:GTP-binding protein [Sulfurovum lithotrophicum]
MIRKKILLLGDFSVGKTSLVRRYVDGAFDDKYLTTIGVKISKKLLTINGVECELLIWDVEGSTPSKKISLGYYRGASGAILVSDITRRDTVNGLEEHKTIFLSENPDSQFVVAYNKADALSEIAKENIQLDEDTFLTSAKDDSNVEELFVRLMEKMLA